MFFFFGEMLRFRPLERDPESVHPSVLDRDPNDWFDSSGFSTVFLENDERADNEYRSIHLRFLLFVEFSTVVRVVVTISSCTASTGATGFNILSARDDVSGDNYINNIIIARRETFDDALEQRWKRKKKKPLYRFFSDRVGISVVMGTPIGEIKIYKNISQPSRESARSVCTGLMFRRRRRRISPTEFVHQN